MSMTSFEPSEYHISRRPNEALPPDHPPVCSSQIPARCPCRRARSPSRGRLLEVLDAVGAEADGVELALGHVERRSGERRLCPTACRGCRRWAPNCTSRPCRRPCRPPWRCWPAWRCPAFRRSTPAGRIGLGLGGRWTTPRLVSSIEITLLGLPPMMSSSDISQLSWSTIMRPLPTCTSSSPPGNSRSLAPSTCTTYSVPNRCFAARRWRSARGRRGPR